MALLQVHNYGGRPGILPSTDNSTFGLNTNATTNNILTARTVPRDINLSFHFETQGPHIRLRDVVRGLATTIVWQYRFGSAQATSFVVDTSSPIPSMPFEISIQNQRGWSFKEPTYRSQNLYTAAVKMVNVPLARLSPGGGALPDPQDNRLQGMEARVEALGQVLGSIMVLPARSGSEE